MSLSSTASRPVSARDRAAGTRSAEPLVPRYELLAAALCITVGLMWDISWDRSRGRDTFWSAPHLLEQLAAVIAGLGCGWLVLRTAFAGGAAEKSRSVPFWGFAGPL